MAWEPLPHPVTLFALICIAVLIISGIAGYFEWSVADPRPEGAKGRSADGMIRAVSLLTPEGLRRISMGLVTNFTSFAPLGTVLVALLGVGVAERAGLLGAAIRALVLGAPRNLLTAVVVFAAVVSNTASEMGYVVLIPLAAVVFHSVGRHPLLGLPRHSRSFGGYLRLSSDADPLPPVSPPRLLRSSTQLMLLAVRKKCSTANYYFLYSSSHSRLHTVTNYIVELKSGLMTRPSVEKRRRRAKDMGALIQTKMWSKSVNTPL